jgi:FAD-linked sulfhydryl oxidase
MPITQIPYPILSQFGSAVTKTTGMPPQPLDATPEQKAQAQAQQDDDTKAPAQLPKGVVLGPDGKPYVQGDMNKAVINMLS